tara:strand:- start:273 stop:674 length:402 start_codon:yes stop_codon:yes gene_type:complete
MNSFINEQGKRSWCRTNENDRILDSFSLLKGYTDEIDTLIVDSLKEIGWTHNNMLENIFNENGVTVSKILHYRVRNRDDNDPFLYVKKKGDKWFASVESAVGCVEEQVLVPRALWGDIRMAWDNYTKVRVDHV